MAINGTALGVASLGGLLLYSAVKGMGVADTARALLAGQAVDTTTRVGDMIASGAAGASAASDSSIGNAGGAGTINRFLKHSGYSRAQRAGIMGNMQIESGFSATALNANEKAIGICQWEGGRRTALQTFARSLGKDETDLSAQLAYFNLEMSSAFAPVSAMIRLSNKPGTVATIVDKSYERSSGSSRAARVAAAQSLFASAVTA